MPIKLIAFDLDGVLAQDPGSWMAVHLGLGTTAQAKEHEREFNDGLIDYDVWAKKDALLWSGVDIRTIEGILAKVPFMKGIEEAIPKLRSRYRIVILSGGLKILADRLKDAFSLDLAIANELLTQDGLIKGIRQAVAFNDKGKLLRDVALRFNLKASECAAVGDYINDVPMFEAAGFSVAFNPKNNEAARRANYVIREKNLTRLLDVF
jgi:phosphoserine phosphatase